MEDYDGRFDFHGLDQAIRQVREERGWTQEYVSELVGESPQTRLRANMVRRDSVALLLMLV